MKLTKRNIASVMKVRFIGIEKALCLDKDVMLLTQIAGGNFSVLSSPI